MPERLMAVLRQTVLVLLLFAVTGALAGVVWWWIWTPPEGVAYQGQWVLDVEGLTSEFSATGIFVVVGAVAGLLAGAAAGLLFDRRELLTLALVVVGSVLAVWVMREVGAALGPPDPAPLAKVADDLTPIPGNLEVAGRSPWTALPAGALIGLAVVYLGLGRRRAA